MFCDIVYYIKYFTSVFAISKILSTWSSYSCVSICCTRRYMYASESPFSGQYRLHFTRFLSKHLQDNNENGKMVKMMIKILLMICDDDDGSGCDYNDGDDNNRITTVKMSMIIAFHMIPLKTSTG